MEVQILSRALAIHAMLYTRKGDGGETSFFGSPERVRKDSPRTEALGALDELNSLLGVCKTHPNAEKFLAGGMTFARIIADIQQTLFIIQAEVAGAPKSVSGEKVTVLEGLINTIESELPTIKSFSSPGGSGFSATLDYARAVARRTERRVISVTDVEIGAHTKSYVNRMSSILFALARLANVRSGIKEEPPTYR